MRMHKYSLSSETSRPNTPRTIPHRMMSCFCSLYLFRYILSHQNRKNNTGYYSNAPILPLSELFATLHFLSYEDCFYSDGL
jgi:hypothetical protein